MKTVKRRALNAQRMHSAINSTDTEYLLAAAAPDNNHTTPSAATIKHLKHSSHNTTHTSSTENTTINATTISTISPIKKDSTPAAKTVSFQLDASSSSSEKLASKKQQRSATHAIKNAATTTPRTSSATVGTLPLPSLHDLALLLHGVDGILLQLELILSGGGMSGYSSRAASVATLNASADGAALPDASLDAASSSGAPGPLATATTAACAAFSTKNITAALAMMSDDEKLTLKEDMEGLLQHHHDGRTGATHALTPTTWEEWLTYWFRTSHMAKSTLPAGIGSLLQAALILVSFGNDRLGAAVSEVSMVDVVQERPVLPADRRTNTMAAQPNSSSTSSRSRLLWPDIPQQYRTYAITLYGMKWVPPLGSASTTSKLRKGGVQQGGSCDKKKRKRLDGTSELAEDVAPQPPQGAHDASTASCFSVNNPPTAKDSLSTLAAAISPTYFQASVGEGSTRLPRCLKMAAGSAALSSIAVGTTTKKSRTKCGFCNGRSSNRCVRFPACTKNVHVSCGAGSGGRCKDCALAKH